MKAKTSALVRTALDELLPSSAAGELVGVSCLARGADSLFAEAVPALGGQLAAVIPSRDYRWTRVRPEHAPVFGPLVEAASRQAYEAANSVLVERADRLVAVWDGTPATGRGGGTADTVFEASAAGVPVDVVWPDGPSAPAGSTTRAPPTVTRVQVPRNRRRAARRLRMLRGVVGMHGLERQTTGDPLSRDVPGGGVVRARGACGSAGVVGGHGVAVRRFPGDVVGVGVRVCGLALVA